MSGGRTETGETKEKDTKPKRSREEQARLDAVHLSYAQFFSNKYGIVMHRLDAPDEENAGPNNQAAGFSTMPTRGKLLPDGIYVLNIAKKSNSQTALPGFLSNYYDDKGNPRFSISIYEGKARPRPPIGEAEFGADPKKFVTDFKEQMWLCMAGLASAQGGGSFTLDIPGISSPATKYDLARLEALYEVAQASKFGVNFGPYAQQVIASLPVESKRRFLTMELGQKDRLLQIQQLNYEHAKSAGGHILSYGRQDDKMSHQANFDVNKFCINEKGEEKFGAERLAGLSGALDKLEERYKDLDAAYGELNREVERYEAILATDEKDFTEALEEEIKEGLEAVKARREGLIKTMEAEVQKLDVAMLDLKTELAKDLAYDPKKPASPSAKDADQKTQADLQKRFDSSSLSGKRDELSINKVQEMSKKFEDTAEKEKDRKAKAAVSRKSP